MDLFCFYQFLKYNEDDMIDDMRYLLNESDVTVTINRMLLCGKEIREPYHIFNLKEPETWLDTFRDLTFFQLFRMKKATFNKLLNVIISNDQFGMLKKRYRGGNKPISPEKALLIFLWYMSKQDPLNSIAEKFRIVPSTVMQIVNNLLYVVVGLKNKYIFWPKTEDEYEQINKEFTRYPGVIGVVDGSHVNIKVPLKQHDSYADRYSNHSINLMAICTARCILTYVFVGYPGSAHDSRVFSNSLFVRNVEKYGKQKYFPKDSFHLIGDSAFPLSTWLMTPYKMPNVTTRAQKKHNYCLSSERVCIEHCFGRVKGRWRRLQFINTYSVTKAIEITTAACILHNFCYFNDDEWNEELFFEEKKESDYSGYGFIREPEILGKMKRANISLQLLS